MRITLVILSCIILSCNSPLPEDYIESDDHISINPDYSQLTIPPNIAPLNFRINQPAVKYIARFSSGNYHFDITSENGKIIIPRPEWSRLLSQDQADHYSIDLFILDEKKQWVKYPAITNRIARETIDPYIVYRLIEPGYELWNRMGIYQRCIENFDEQAIITNRMKDNNCINCHSFHQRDPSAMMMLHMRGAHAGTYIFKDGKVQCVNTRTDETISAGVYPSWHPSGKKIAFSTNKTIQFFHATPGQRIEVFDLESDIIIYDLESGQVTTPAELNHQDKFETFPHWSPDGEYLYFCSADARPLSRYDQVKYSLLRIKYDISGNSFGETDTIYSAHMNKKSVSFPRVSPDGKWLMATISGYGNFSIWHKSADLYVIDLTNGDIHKLPVNSDQPESYHSWSGNGQWFIFSSKRDDGLYTRLYLSHFDTNGQASKPFILPQEDPDFYDTFLKAYNIPELVTGKVPLKARHF